jgi:hypothetical protein
VAGRSGLMPAAPGWRRVRRRYALTAESFRVAGTGPRGRPSGDTRAGTAGGRLTRARPAGRQAPWPEPAVRGSSIRPRPESRVRRRHGPRTTRPVLPGQRPRRPSGHPRIREARSRARLRARSRARLRPRSRAPPFLWARSRARLRAGSVAPPRLRPRGLASPRRRARSRTPPCLGAGTLRHVHAGFPAIARPRGPAPGTAHAPPAEPIRPAPRITRISPATRITSIRPDPRISPATRSSHVSPADHVSAPPWTAAHTGPPPRVRSPGPSVRTSGCAETGQRIKWVRPPRQGTGHGTRRGTGHGTGHGTRRGTGHGTGHGTRRGPRVSARPAALHRDTPPPARATRPRLPAYFLPPPTRTRWTR